MKTDILRFDSFDTDQVTIRIAADIIKSGGLVAFPTETVYGLGADALNPVACAKIFQKDISCNGHAIECRINAEDPDNNFMPSPGKVTMYHPSGGFGVRVDSHLYTGYSVPPYYDSLIAKLIVHADDRRQAIARMRRALGEFIVEGIKTTIPFHLRVLDNSDFQKGEYSTKFIEEKLMKESA